MPCKVIVARDFDHMSEIAAGILVEAAREALAHKARCALGLATGNSPTGLYAKFAATANKGALDTSRIRSFNLDEYVGLPGENAQQRALHPESYSFFMTANLFGKLDRTFAETSVPWGTLVDVDRLDAELKAHPGDWVARGTHAGKSIAIRANAASAYLRWIREAILDAYERKIEAAGGVDLQVLGSGEKGHVGFHEAGIPFEDSRMLLVRLDENTIENAVKDGHFASRAQSPTYAVSMGAELIYRARTVLLLANGGRKTDVIAKSLLEEPDCSVPLSYGQIYVQRGGNLICVVDRVAATGLISAAGELARRGVELDNRS